MRGYRKDSGKYREELVTLLLLLGFEWTYCVHRYNWQEGSRAVGPSRRFRRPGWLVTVHEHRTSISSRWSKDFTGVHHHALDYFRKKWIDYE